MIIKYSWLVQVIYLFAILSVLIFNSCGQKKEKEVWRHVELSPKDESQTITIITKGNKRYFMNGKHQEIPRDEYLLLDLSKVDHLGDGVSVCWNEPEGYKWKIASAYAEIIENKLDTTKFSYYQPLGKYGEPVSTGYTSENCGGFLIREHQPPRGDLKVAYITKE